MEIITSAIHAQNFINAFMYHYKFRLLLVKGISRKLNHAWCAKRNNISNNVPDKMHGTYEYFRLHDKEK